MNKPTDEQWAAICEAIGPTGVQPAEYLPDFIRRQREICARLQETVQAHKLGLGGEKVDELVCEALEEAFGLLVRERRALAEFLIPWRSHLSTTWLNHFEKSGAVYFDGIGAVYPSPVWFGKGRKDQSLLTSAPTGAGLEGGSDAG